MTSLSRNAQIIPQILRCTFVRCTFVMRVEA
jgi:hypothetical protein